MAKINEHPNVVALLDTIAYTEGTDIPRQPTRDEGYDVLVGGRLFASYLDHPNILVKLNANLSSTAAGRYQILYRFWKVYKQRLNLLDFSPMSQDLYAVNIFKEQKGTNAYNLIKEGHFEEAIKKINNIWASLPDSPYGQHTYSMEHTKAVYVMKGGTYV